MLVRRDERALCYVRLWQVKRGLADSVRPPPRYERTGAAAAKFTRNATSPAAGLGVLGSFEFKRPRQSDGCDARITSGVKHDARKGRQPRTHVRYSARVDGY